jgi:hypothetical protein
MKFSEWLKFKEDGDLNSSSPSLETDPANRSQYMNLDKPPSDVDVKVFGRKRNGKRLTNRPRYSPDSQDKPTTPSVPST